MPEQRLVRTRKSILVVALALILVGGTTVLVWRHAIPVDAHFPHSTLDFSITVDDQCDSSSGDTTCDVADRFTLAFEITSMPSGMQYRGYNSRINHDALDVIGGSLIQDQLGVWPCVFAASHAKPPVLEVSCAVGLNEQDSTYVGVMHRVDFQCPSGSPSTETITLTHGVDSGNTSLHDANDQHHGETGDETLTINCNGATPSATPTFTPTETPTFTPTATFTPGPTDDEDGDGIAHSIDSLPKIFSENFSDVYLGGQTYGTVFHAPGLTLTVSDASFPEGVRVVGSGTGGPSPVVTFCTPHFSTYISPGSDVTITCASADVRVSAGSPVMWFGSLISKLSPGADVRVTEPSSGMYNVTNNGSSGITIGGVGIAAGGSTNGLVDTDTDGLADSAETALGTNPNASDSDGDALNDGLEFAMYGTSPLLIDSDGDGCTETQELGNNQIAGGQRNPANAYDYFNPSHDKLNRVDDILLIVQAYFDDDNDGNPGLPPYVPGYKPDKDRTLVGPNAWNLGPPNGLQRVDDILNQVKQYFHDCA